MITISHKDKIDIKPLQDNQGLSPLATTRSVLVRKSNRAFYQIKKKAGKKLSSLTELKHIHPSLSEEEGEPEEVLVADSSPSFDHTAQGFLSIYFREMAKLSMLTAEQELMLAKKLSDAEVQTWKTLLLFFPLQEKLFSFWESKLSPVFKELKTWKNQDLSKITEKQSQEIELLAEKMHSQDEDRVLLEESMSFVEKLDISKIKLTEKGVGLLQNLLLIHHEVKKTREHFVKANLRLVVSIARRFYQGRMPLADLIQEGNLGLLKAVERFDYRRGYRFSTYASWWIRHAISRALADKGRAVRVPVHMIDTYYRLSKSRRDLMQKMGRQPSNEEMSQETGVSIDKIEKMNAYLLESSFSIDQGLSDDDRRQFIDLIEDESPTVHPMESLMNKTMSTEIDELFTQLSPIESDVLKQRFGFDSNSEEEETLKEIGKKYHLSRERIRQIQEKALRKLREGLLKKDLL